MSHVLAAAQDNAAHGNNIFGFIIAAVIVLVVLGFLVLFVAALISILGSDLSGGMKIVWTVFAFCAPFLGSLLWFVIGRADSRRQVGLASRS